MSTLPNDPFTFSTHPSMVPVTHNEFIFGSNFPAQHAFKPDIPIDPALLSFPSDAYERNTGGASGSVPSAVTHRPAIKIAGSCRKAKEPATKGKKKANEADSAETKAPKRGRPYGSANFTDADIWALLEAVANELPLGERGWKAVQVAFNKYAHKHGHKQRSSRSLKLKYKQFIRKGKPTGDGVCPPHIERAFEIEDKINERAGTRDINDSELDDNTSLHSEPAETSSEDENEKDRVVATVKCVASEQTPGPRRRQTMTGAGLMKKIANSLNPSAQRKRDNDRAGYNLSAMQILTLSQQLCDAHQVANTLRSEINQLLTRAHAAESAHERSELKLEFLGLSKPQFRDSRKRRRTRRQELVTRRDKSVEIISLTDTDSLSAHSYDEHNKENHPIGQPRRLTRARPFPKLEELDTPRDALQTKLNGSDTDLPSPSVAYLPHPADAMQL